MFTFMLIVAGLGFIALGVHQGEWAAVVVGLAILAPVAIINLAPRRRLTREELIERFFNRFDK